MKISPVQGTPTIPNNPQSGASPEKLARLKATLFSNQTPEEEKEQNLGAVALNANQTPSIKMNVNKTPEANTLNGVLLETDTPNGVEIAKSDTNEQANATTEVTEPLSPQLAALARQRRALQVEREVFAKDKEALERAKSLEARIKSQPLSVLQELGVTYDQLTQDILAQQNGYNPEIHALKDELKSLKEDFNKTLSEKDAANEQAVLAQIKRNVDTMSFSGDEFELIRETKSQQDVVDLIHKTWKETGQVLDEQEAMSLIETELLTDSLKLAKLKKIQGQLTPPEPVQIPPQTQGGMKTLTNKDQASPAISRRQRAIAAMLGQKR